jgi:hypothetical protein
MIGSSVHRIIGSFAPKNNSPASSAAAGRSLRSGENREQFVVFLQADREPFESVIRRIASYAA